MAGIVSIIDIYLTLCGSATCGVKHPVFSFVVYRLVIIVVFVVLRHVHFVLERTFDGCVRILGGWFWGVLLLDTPEYVLGIVSDVDEVACCAFTCLWCWLKSRHRRHTQNSNESAICGQHTNHQTRAAHSLPGSSRIFRTNIRVFACGNDCVQAGTDSP